MLSGLILSLLVILVYKLLLDVIYCDVKVRG